MPDFCVQALSDTTAEYDTPETMNSHQGSKDMGSVAECRGSNMKGFGLEAVLVSEREGAVFRMAEFFRLLGFLGGTAPIIRA